MKLDHLKSDLSLPDGAQRPIKRFACIVSAQLLQGDLVTPIKNTRMTLRFMQETTPSGDDSRILEVSEKFDALQMKLKQGASVRIEVGANPCTVRVVNARGDRLSGVKVELTNADGRPRWTQYLQTNDDGECSSREVAEHFGCTTRNIQIVVARALVKLRMAGADPDLVDAMEAAQARERRSPLGVAQDELGLGKVWK